MHNSGITLVQKEELNRYHFFGHEVLESEIEIENRRVQLLEAVLLGNSEKQKVKMIFETEEGTIMVETTVWECNDSYIELKGITYVPICCIKEVII